MIKAFNILRFVAPFIVPLFFLYDITLALVAIFLTLFLNNWFDDIVFYYGSLAASGKNYRGGMASPANGIVTNVAYNKPFEHISKNDNLTKEVFVRFTGMKNNHQVYNHVTIFLNKLNMHVVGNIGRTSNSYLCANVGPDGILEMVEPGELIPKKNGRYEVKNTVIVIDYDDEFVVITMDKYISRAIAANKKLWGFEYLICRGSQVDIFTKRHLLVHEGDKVELYQSIAGPYIYDNADKIIVDKKEILSMIKQAIPDGVFELFVQNLKKTFSTFNNLVFEVLLVCFIATLIFGHGVLFTASMLALFLYFFTAVRSIKMLMYSLMNVTGDRPIYHKIFKNVSKLNKLWQKRNN